MNETSHRLTGRDPDSMNAMCSVCGPVKMRTRGKGRYVCGVRETERKAQWAARNPEKTRRNRRGRSAHHLSSFDESTLTGECPVCGTVGVVAKGRGFMCRVRAEELWTTQQDRPQSKCAVCRRVWLAADGSCSYCSDPIAHSVSAGLRAERDTADLQQLVHDWVEDVKPITGLVNVKTHNPYEMPRAESAEPRWRTLGTGDPNDWWAANAHLVEGAGS